MSSGLALRALDPGQRADDHAGKHVAAVVVEVHVSSVVLVAGQHDALSKKLVLFGLSSALEVERGGQRSPEERRREQSLGELVAASVVPFAVARLLVAVEATRSQSRRSTTVTA
ncbi:hypothetical protein MRX96_036075 [Rhipicephalus microplus]